MQNAIALLFVLCSLEYVFEKIKLLISFLKLTKYANYIGVKGSKLKL